MQKTTKTILILIIVAAIIIVTGLLVSQRETIQATEVTKVKVAYLPVVQGLPLYLGIEKGYFNEAGIEVEAVKLDNPNLIIDSLLSGQVDFGAPGTASGITGISEHVKPGVLKIFALIGGDISTTNDVLIVKNDSELETIADLKGKKLGILPGIQFRTIAKHILAENGLSVENDVIIVELAPPLQVQALAAGQVDAVLTIEPLGTIAQVRGVGKELIHAPMVQYISEPWYGAVGVVRTEYAQKHPQITESVLDIFDRAIKEINKNPELAKQYLKGYTALDEQLIHEVPLPIFKMYSDFTDIDVESLQKFFDIFTQYEVIDSNVDARQLIYTN